MVCIHCYGPTQVINSRPQKRTNQIWRRRQCRICKAVFTTGETADYATSWLVKHSNTTLEPFSRDRLFISVYKSMEHRTSALSDAGAVTDTIIQKLVQSMPGTTIEARTISQMAQVALHRFDTAASVYYAAFHKS